MFDETFFCVWWGADRTSGLFTLFNVIVPSCLLVFFSLLQIRLARTSSSPPPPPFLTLHHEGFFWRCVFQVEPMADTLLATVYSRYRPQAWQAEGRWCGSCFWTAPIICVFKENKHERCQMDFPLCVFSFSILQTSFCFLFILKQTSQSPRVVSRVTSSLCPSHSDMSLIKVTMPPQVNTPIRLKEQNSDSTGGVLGSEGDKFIPLK